MGELRWQDRLSRQEAFAYFFAGDESRGLASFMNQIYEFVPATGTIGGPMAIEPSVEIFRESTFEVTFEQEAWVQGLGLSRGRAFVLGGDRLFEVLPGPRLELREELDQNERLQVALTDENGELIGFQGNGVLRVLRRDGTLAPAAACPWERHGLARLNDEQLVSYSNRLIFILDAVTGEETHVFEAANNIRSLKVEGGSETRVVIGRDVLKVIPS
jgi:hypothetical protein